MINFVKGAADNSGAPYTERNEHVMTQTERRIFLIRELLSEQPEFASLSIPQNEQMQKNLLRALFNIRMPEPASKKFLQIQNAYLQEECRQKGITEFSELKPIQQGIYLWQGDITTLRCDAIVNAANTQLLGCFIPCHKCIDNAIHTFAGVQLRRVCKELMEQQNCYEPVGTAKITPAFNLPCRYILHTVGPTVYTQVTDQERNQLASCYRSCLCLAQKHKIKNIAFCCISTGEFRFPNKEAAEIAIKTVKEYIKKTNCTIEVIFNVFRDVDLALYRQLLG